MESLKAILKSMLSSIYNFLKYKKAINNNLLIAFIKYYKLNSTYSNIIPTDKIIVDDTNIHATILIENFTHVP